MTNTTPPLTELVDAVAPARRRHHELIDAACAWQIGRHRQTDPVLFALICAATESSYDEFTATRWTRVGTYQVARAEIPDWCSRHRCLWPDATLDALWNWFDFLHETGRMDRASDPVAELRKPLACYGRLDQHGNPLPRGVGREIECECFLPYRETAELLGELARQAERTGEHPLDPLRRALGRATGRDDGRDDGRSWSTSGS